MVRQLKFQTFSTSRNPVTAVGFHPGRREIIVGFEDGTIRWFEQDTGRLTTFSSPTRGENTAAAHSGRITDFLYWHELKLLVSSSFDHTVKFWAGGGRLVDTIRLGCPIFVMARNRRQQVVIGFEGAIKVFNLDPEKESEHHLNITNPYVRNHHTDIVTCIQCYENRIYTAGYDNKLVVYDQSVYQSGTKSLDLLHENPAAHNAGITCMCLIVDQEFNAMLLTGSFDRCVKVWSTDGQLRRKIDANFVSKITSICYSPKTKTVWIAQEKSNQLVIFDPKTGENVTSFLSGLLTPEEGHCNMLRYGHESGQIVTVTHRHIVVFRFGKNGPITTLRTKEGIERLCYTKKVPILVFSGASNGDLMKFEATQSSQFIYNHEILPFKEGVERAVDQQRQKGIEATSSKRSELLTAVQNQGTALLDIKFCEKLDCLVAASQDSNIYLWGFETSAVDALCKLSNEEEEIYEKYRILLPAHSKPKIEENPESSEGARENKIEDSVTNRVAGFICKHVFIGHSSSVSCLAVVENPENDEIFLLSGGWDKKIFGWNLRNCENINPYGDGLFRELTDDAILAIDYNGHNGTFAFSTANNHIFIHKWSSNYREIKLLQTLKGHWAEVSCVKWHSVIQRWVSGSEDGTIRVWADSGEEEKVLSVKKPISCLVCDKNNEFIIAGVESDLCVYDSSNGRQVAVYSGHKDTIKSVIHLVERNQYITGSLDMTINIWNAAKQTKKEEEPEKTEPDS